MIIRDNYKPKNYLLSTTNEPNFNTNIKTNVRQYPDMYKAYNKFKEIFDVGDNFILSNGCENSLKNMLLAIGNKTLVMSKPNWGMVDVICNALHIGILNYEFYYDNGFKLNYDRIKNTYANVLYINAGYTPSFKFDFDLSYLDDFIGYEYIILDITYLNIDEMKEIISKTRDDKRIIIIGSFDKCVGCGLRLGFAIYPKALHINAQLQREQYINSTAVNWLLNNNIVNKQNKIVSELKSKLVNDIVSDNYITVKGNIETDIPHKSFEIFDKLTNEYITFSRFGIPTTKKEMKKLLHLIN